jgi:hypothetical protein
VTLLPGHYETFVLDQTQEQVIKKISGVTTAKVRFQNQLGVQYRFTGWVKKNRFRIALKITKPNNYIPLIIGKVDPTINGCLIFVNYQLFPVTKMFLLFWSFFILLAGIISTYQYQSYFYAAVTLLVLGAIHWITWSNFKIQLRLTRKTLLEILT